MYIQTLGDFGEYKTKTFIESTQNFVTFLYYLRPQSDLKITQNKVKEKKVSEIVFWVILLSVSMELCNQGTHHHKKITFNAFVISFSYFSNNCVSFLLDFSGTLTPVDPNWGYLTQNKFFKLHVILLCVKIDLGIT